MWAAFIWLQCSLCIVDYLNDFLTWGAVEQKRRRRCREGQHKRYKDTLKSSLKEREIYTPWVGFNSPWMLPMARSLECRCFTLRGKEDIAISEEIRSTHRPIYYKIQNILASNPTPSGGSGPHVHYRVVQIKHYKDPMIGLFKKKTSYPFSRNFVFI